MKSRLLAQRLDQWLAGGLVHAQYLRQRIGHQFRTGQRSQVNEPDPVSAGLAHLGRRIAFNPEGD